MEKLSEIIDYIIKNKSNILYFCMNTERYRYSRTNTPGIGITFINQNRNKKCFEMFEDICLDLDFDKMFQILRENHIDIIDTDVDDQANNLNDSLYSNDWVFGVFACIDNIKKIETDYSQVIEIYCNTEIFHIEPHVDLKKIFASHGRYDLALML